MEGADDESLQSQGLSEQLKIALFTSQAAAMTMWNTLESKKGKLQQTAAPSRVTIPKVKQNRVKEEHGKSEKKTQKTC